MSEGKEHQLPPGWAEATIDDLFWPLEDGRTLHQGWSPQCEKTPAPTEAHWGVLKTTAIQAGTFLSQHNKQLPKHLAPRPQIEVKAGDILITCAGPRARCGVACLVRNTRPRLMMSGKMYRFRVSPDDMDARFLEAFLLSPKATAAIDKMKTGGSDSGLNLTYDRFRPLLVPVAPINEQRRIMDTVDELLSDLDAGVAGLERVRVMLRSYRASVLKAAVEGALTTDWRAQYLDTEPASALLQRILVERRVQWEAAQLKRFKQAGKPPTANWKTKYKEPATPNSLNLPALPESWCWATVSQCSELIQYGTSSKTNPDSTGIPVLRMGNIRTDGSLDLEDLKYLPASHDEFPALLLESGDLLFNRTNSAELVGKTGYYRGSPAICSFASYLIRVRLLKGASPGIVSFALNGGGGRRWIKSVVTQMVGQANVNGSKLGTFAFPLPPEAEQEAVVEGAEEQMSVIDHLEADIESKLKSARALRQTILRHAFSGQLVPQDPNEEPASELLKRITLERDERARLAISVTHASRKAMPTKPLQNKASRKRALSRELTKDSP